MNKHIALLTRKKTLLLVTLVAPLLIILLAVFAYDNTTTTTFTIATLNTTTTDAEDIIATLSNGGFNITRTTMQEDCITSVAAGNVHACITFADNFTYSSANNTITFHLDPSQTGLVNILDQRLQNNINIKSRAKSLSLAGNLLTTLTNIKTTATTATTHLGTAAIATEATKNNITSAQTAITALTFPTPPGNATTLDATRATLNTSTTTTFLSILKTLTSIKTTLGTISVIDNNQTNITNHTKTINNTINTLITLITTDSNTTNATLTTLDQNIKTLNQQLSAFADTLKKSEEHKTATSTGITAALKNVESQLSTLKELNTAITTITSATTALTVTNETQIATPITTSIKPILSQTTRLPYVFPTLAVLLLTLTSFLITATITIYDRTSPARIREELSPSPPWKNIVSLFATGAITTFLQTLLILALLIIFSIIPASAIPSTLLTFTIISITMTSIGLLVGLTATSEEQAILTSAALITGMLILSNTFLPLATLPTAVQTLSSYNPLAMGVTLLKNSILHNQELKETLLSALPLLTTTLLFLTISAILTRRKPSHALKQQKQQNP